VGQVRGDGGDEVGAIASGEGLPGDTAHDEVGRGQAALGQDVGEAGRLPTDEVDPGESRDQGVGHGRVELDAEVADVRHRPAPGGGEGTRSRPCAPVAVAVAVASLLAGVELWADAAPVPVPATVARFEVAVRRPFRWALACATGAHIAQRPDAGLADEFTRAR
jgi:hypothetical protein